MDTSRVGGVASPPLMCSLDDTHLSSREIVGGAGVTTKRATDFTTAVFRSYLPATHSGFPELLEFRVGTPINNLRDDWFESRLERHASRVIRLL